MYILCVNIAALLVGTGLGCGVKKFVPRKLQENSMVYFAIIMLVLGIRLVNRTSSLSAVVIAFLLGGTIGHFLRLDARLSALPEKFSGKSGQFDMETFLSGFTIFCVSSSGFIGAMDLGFSGDATLLITKAVMDFLAAIFFAAAGAGWIQALISIPLAGILFGLYFASGLIMPYVTEGMIGDFSSCGGMILMVNALRLAKLKNPPVLDLIPALILIFPISWLWSSYVGL